MASVNRYSLRDLPFPAPTLATEQWRIVHHETGVCVWQNIQRGEIRGLLSHYDEKHGPGVYVAERQGLRYALEIDERALMDALCALLIDAAPELGAERRGFLVVDLLETLKRSALQSAAPVEPYEWKCDRGLRRTGD